MMDSYQRIETSSNFDKIKDALAAEMMSIDSASNKNIFVQVSLFCNVSILASFKRNNCSNFVFLIQEFPFYHLND